MGPVSEESRARICPFENQLRFYFTRSLDLTMSIVHHIRGNEHPLGQNASINVRSEIIEVSVTCSTRRVTRDAAVDRTWVMFTLIVGVRCRARTDVVGRCVINTEEVVVAGDQT